MSHPLPYQNYRWLSEQETAQLEMKIRSTGGSILLVSEDKGYWLTVDLAYPDLNLGWYDQYPLFRYVSPCCYVCGYTPTSNNFTHFIPVKNAR